MAHGGFVLYSALHDPWTWIVLVVIAIVWGLLKQHNETRAWQEDQRLTRAENQMMAQRDREMLLALLRPSERPPAEPRRT